MKNNNGPRQSKQANGVIKSSKNLKHKKRTKNGTVNKIRTKSKIKNTENNKNQLKLNKKLANKIINKKIIQNNSRKVTPDKMKITKAKNGKVSKTLDKTTDKMKNKTRDKVANKTLTNMDGVRKAVNNNNQGVEISTRINSTQVASKIKDKTEIKNCDLLDSLIVEINILIIIN